MKLGYSLYGAFQCGQIIGPSPASGQINIIIQTSECHLIGTQRHGRQFFDFPVEQIPHRDWCLWWTRQVQCNQLMADQNVWLDNAEDVLHTRRPGCPSVCPNIVDLNRPTLTTKRTRKLISIPKVMDESWRSSGQLCWQQQVINTL